MMQILSRQLADRWADLVRLAKGKTSFLSGSLSINEPIFGHLEKFTFN